MQENRTILQTDNLCLSYNCKEILHYNDLSVTEQQHTLIVGQSGAGKTSLLKACAGMMPPEKGRVLLQGRDIYALPENKRDTLRRQSLAYMPQTWHLIPALTVADNILLSLPGSKTATHYNRLNHLAEALNIASVLGKYPDSLSQGQSQRAAMARAIMPQPALLLADEPTSSLDDHNTQRLIDLLLKLVSEAGTTLIVATHDHRIMKSFHRHIPVGQA